MEIIFPIKGTYYHEKFFNIFFHDFFQKTFDRIIYNKVYLYKLNKYIILLFVICYLL